ncbi:hypothetical protein GCM10023205_59520 [Yinghuangia aomiensis]|uniref:TIGR04255 family protein n=1 Tax=Yinghuangia aomiensis TaxID=676205 RepID=A0ABP9HZD2_9ACTN
MNAELEIWNPALHIDAATPSLRFDVTSTGVAQLADGDPRLMRDFCTALKIRCGDDPSWRITRFVSPFFAADPAGDTWQQRYIPAWSLEVTDPSIGEFTDVFTPYPMGVATHDSTWKPLDPERGDDRPVIVIAARVATGPDDVPPESPAEAFPEMDVELRETPMRDGMIQQFRVNLGALDPQRDAAEIDAAAAACQELGFRTFWLDLFTDSLGSGGEA